MFADIKPCREVFSLRRGIHQQPAVLTVIESKIPAEGSVLLDRDEAAASKIRLGQKSPALGVSRRERIHGGSGSDGQ